MQTSTQARTCCLGNVEASAKPKVKIEVIEQQLFRNQICEVIKRDYGLTGNYSHPQQFSKAILEALRQTPIEDPLGATYTNKCVFEAAVRALGSNGRRWSLFLEKEPGLRAALQGYDPALVVSRGITPASIMQYLPGTTVVNDSHAIIAWAHLLLAVPDYYERVIASVAQGIRKIDPSLTLPELLICLVVFFGSDPDFLDASHAFAATMPKLLHLNKWLYKSVYRNSTQKEIVKNVIRYKWKFPGMRYALGSEFMRNLRWNGFKVDRHIKRLFSRWVPATDPVVENRAHRLAAFFGRRVPAELNEYLYFSLLGIELSPAGVWYSHVDNLVWALGAYVEKKDQESLIDYVK